MSELSANGAKIFTRLFATDAFVSLRDWISPAIRCEKNAIGIRRIFHIKLVLPITASLPLIRSEYTVCTHETTICMRDNADKPMINGINQSGFRPVRRRSRNIRENTG
ncbi:hypothetical protein SDC9_162043 [bioreactor metagenome]|uniref:Uncharacterized protein n=1 Tax=bioreactor metagenome TaxID=1076179 RepID=A0A645FM31_9ZZZZ